VYGNVGNHEGANLKCMIHNGPWKDLNPGWGIPQLEWNFRLDTGSVKDCCDGRNRSPLLRKDTSTEGDPSRTLRFDLTQIYRAGLGVRTTALGQQSILVSVTCVQCLHRAEWGAACSSNANYAVVARSFLRPCWTPPPLACSVFIVQSGLRLAAAPQITPWLPGVF